MTKFIRLYQWDRDGVQDYTMVNVDHIRISPYKASQERCEELTGIDEMRSMAFVGERHPNTRGWDYNDVFYSDMTPDEMVQFIHRLTGVCMTPVSV